MPTPSRVNRALVRPLVAGVVAGALGAGVGLIANSLTPPANTLAAYAITPGLFWPLVAGVLWFFLGLFRGARQAPAWPIAYALVRWVLRTLFWALALVGLAVVILVSGQQFASE